MKPVIIFAAIAATAFACLLVYLNVTIFVVQPIGAVPEGRTVILARRGQLRFIESADAICAREMGGVSLLCRGMAMSVVAKVPIYARLPYSQTLYLISTGGATYDR